MSETIIHTAPVGVPSNPAAVATPVNSAPAAPVAVPAAPSTTAPAATPPAAVDPAATPAPAAGVEAPKDNILADPLKTGDDTKPAAEPDKPVEMKPEDYKFELPAGLTAEDPLLARFTEGAAKIGLPQDVAQKLVSELGPKFAEQLAAPQQAWNKLQSDWQTAVRTDPTIGGAELPNVVARVTGLLREFGHPDLPSALAISGMGNNLPLISTLNALAKRLTESGLVTGGAPALAQADPSTKLYTSTSDAASKQA